MKKENLTPAKVKVKRSKAGLGLFAAADIKKGQFIIEYKGPILTTAQANEKGGQYLFEINSRKTIDGSVRSNTARYINHSCRPNCEPIIKLGRIFIHSKKTIKAGEELNYDYGKEFFNDYVKPKGCVCEKCAKKK
jgi:uncharacterized protein